MRTPVFGPVTDTLVMKHERAIITSWPGRIKTIVLMRRDMIPARHLACPLVVGSDAVGIRRIEWLHQILAHQVSAVVGASEALQRAILQDDRLEFRKNRVTELACRGPTRDIANRDGSRCRESDDDKGDTNSMSTH